MTSLEEIELHLEEMEAVKLVDFDCMEQEDAAKKMKISRQTFGRILLSARKIIANALINGKAIKIEGGENNMTARKFTCYSCNHNWEEPYGTGRPDHCPKCESKNIHRAVEDKGWARRGPMGRSAIGACRRGFGQQRGSQQNAAR